MPKEIQQKRKPKATTKAAKKTLVNVSKRNQKPLKAFDFLKEHAESQTEFSLTELAKIVGWSKKTVQAYKTKKWISYLDSKGDGKYTVRRKFKRVTSEQYLREFTQNETLATSYDRELHDGFIQFEFLIPLTREDKLRRALDDVFYGDTIEMRALDLGLENFESIVGRNHEWSDEQYACEIGRAVGGKIGGYSISHVNGRYKTREIVNRKTAGEMLATDQAYLIDETTASVRFLIPFVSGSKEFGERVEQIISGINSPNNINPDVRAAEVKSIRSLFFLFFVEAVVETIQGEEEIWLVETGIAQRIYRWKRKS